MSTAGRAAGQAALVLLVLAGCAARGPEPRRKAPGDGTPVAALAPDVDRPPEPREGAASDPPPAARGEPARKPEGNRPLLWKILHEPGCGGAMTAISVSPHDSKRILVCGDMLGVGLSEDRGDSWQATFGFHDWNIADVTWHPTDPGVVWVGTMTGPYVSRDGGRNWTLRREGFPPTSGGHYSAPIEKILFDPRDANRLLAFGGSSRRMGSPGKPLWGVVWESLDGGETWERLVTLTREGSTTAMDVEGVNITAAVVAPRRPGRIYALLDWGGLLVSEDSGRTWKARNEGLPSRNARRLAVHPADGDTLWVSLAEHKPGGEKQCLPGGVYKSTDGGKAWRDSSAGLSQARHEKGVFTANYHGLAVAPGRPDELYVNDCAWNTGVLYKSTDGGASWRPIATKGNVGHEQGGEQRRIYQVKPCYFAGLGMGYIAVDPGDPDAVFGINSEYVIRSLDGGRTWDDATAYRPPGKSGWRGRGYSGLCSTNIRFNPWRKGHSILTAMDAGKCWESADGLGTWTFHGSKPWPWGGGNDAVFTKSSHIYVTTGQFGSHGSVVRTRDGKTWDTIAGKEHGLPEFNGQGTADGIYALPDEPEKVWVCFGGRLYRSTDAGERWELALDRPGLAWLAGDPREPARFYVSGKEGVLVTEDGEDFRLVGGPKPAGRLHVDSRGRVYTVSWREPRGGIWRMAPIPRQGFGGRRPKLQRRGADGEWRRLLDDRFVYDVASDPTEPARIVAVTNDHNYHDICFARGVYVSADDGRSWSLANDGLAMTRGQAVAVNPHDPEEIVFGTFGRGFFKARWPKGHVPKGDIRYESTEEDGAYADPGAGLLRNGSMTMGRDVPSSWTKWGDVEIARDTTVFKKGPASLLVRTLKANASGQGLQMIEGCGGARIRATGFAKSEGDVKVNVAVQSFNADWSRNEFKQVRYLQGTQDWVAFSAEVRIPDWAARFCLQLLVQGTGRAWLDEAKVVKLEEPEPAKAPRR